MDLWIFRRWVSITQSNQEQLLIFPHRQNGFLVRSMCVRPCFFKQISTFLEFSVAFVYGCQGRTTIDKRSRTILGPGTDTQKNLLETLKFVKNKVYCAHYFYMCIFMCFPAVWNSWINNVYIWKKIFCFDYDIKLGKIYTYEKSVLFWVLTQKLTQNNNKKRNYFGLHDWLRTIHFFSLFNFWPNRTKFHS